MPFSDLMQVSYGGQPLLEEHLAPLEQQGAVQSLVVVNILYSKRLIPPFSCMPNGGRLVNHLFLPV